MESNFTKEGRNQIDISFDVIKGEIFEDIMIKTLKNVNIQKYKDLFITQLQNKYINNKRIINDETILYFNNFELNNSGGADKDYDLSLLQSLSHVNKNGNKLNNYPRILPIEIKRRINDTSILKTISIREDLVNSKLKKLGDEKGIILYLNIYPIKIIFEGNEVEFVNEFNFKTFLIKEKIIYTNKNDKGEFLFINLTKYNKLIDSFVNSFNKNDINFELFYNGSVNIFENLLKTSILKTKELNYGKKVIHIPNNINEKITKDNYFGIDLSNDLFKGKLIEYFNWIDRNKNKNGFLNVYLRLNLKDLIQFINDGNYSK